MKGAVSADFHTPWRVSPPASTYGVTSPVAYYTTIQPQPQRCDAFALAVLYYKTEKKAEEFGAKREETNVKFVVSRIPLSIGGTFSCVVVEVSGSKNASRTKNDGVARRRWD